MLSAMEYPYLIQALERDGIRVPPEAPAQWDRHAALVREWNPIASLVSLGDARQLEDIHLPDALSLAGILRSIGLDKGTLIDIGSGGGYPAIPLKIALPELSVCLVERSVTKIGFLRKAVAALGLQGVEIIHGEFPSAVRERNAQVVTARAVELPSKIHKALSVWLVVGSVFLCQSGIPAGFEEDMFHVEHWEDDWTKQGLRRGELHLVRRVL